MADMITMFDAWSKKAFEDAKKQAWLSAYQRRMDAIHKIMQQPYFDKTPIAAQDVIKIGLRY